MAGTDKKGTNILGLVEAAEKMGFLAKGVRGDWDSLFKIPKPAIAHVIVKEALHHFVVLSDTTDKYIEIMDPADGVIHKISHEEFKKQWTGVLVLIAPGEKFSVKNEKVSTGVRFWRLIKPNQEYPFTVIDRSTGIFSVLGLSMSIYVGKIVDNVLPGGNLSLLNLLGIVYGYNNNTEIIIKFFPVPFCS